MDALVVRTGSVEGFGVAVLCVLSGADAGRMSEPDPDPDMGVDSVGADVSGGRVDDEAVAGVGTGEGETLSVACVDVLVTLSDVGTEDGTTWSDEDGCEDGMVVSPDPAAGHLAGVSSGTKAGATTVVATEGVVVWSVAGA